MPNTNPNQEFCSSAEWQEENWKINEHVEMKQHSPEQSMIREEIKVVIKFLETNENEKSTFQNLWDAVKVVLREKFIEKSAYNTKQKKCIPKKHLTLYLRN